MKMMMIMKRNLTEKLRKKMKLKLKVKLRRQSNPIKRKQNTNKKMTY